MRKCLIPLVSMAALAACGETTAQRATTGAVGGGIAGAVVGGPIGALVGAGAGAAGGAYRENIDEQTDRASAKTREAIAEATEGEPETAGGPDRTQETRVRSADRIRTHADEGTMAGPTNAEVEDAQVALKDLGLYDGAIDGIYGKKTIRAVNSFQADNDLPRTGTLTQRTQTRLKQVASAGGAQQNQQPESGTTQNQGGTAPGTETPAATPQQEPSEGPTESPVTSPRSSGQSQ